MSTVFPDQGTAAPAAAPVEPVVPAVEPTSVPTLAQPDPYNDLLKGITSEDGRAKYATVSDALNAIPHKEQHISKIEQENATYRAEVEQLKSDLAKADGVSSVLEKLDARQVVGDPTPTGITEQDVLRVLNDKNSKDKQDANAATVANAMREKFGLEDATRVTRGETATRSPMLTRPRSASSSMMIRSSPM